ncbi:Putative DNA-binding domain-containing protein [bacterium JGI 053]|nr:Putative DNA-binding domain-containing protein [bacterium JGI 053]
MLNPREWTEEYVSSLPVGEFDWLEVKGRRGLDLTLPQVTESAVRETLAKAISAFANSGGGILVYGLANPTEIWAVDDGGVDLKVKGSGTREWLEDVIPTLVEFPLTTFNVYAIQRVSENSELAPGRGLLIIEIGDSDTAPHQSVIDHRYYARIGGKSRPLPHRLVADIFNRRRDPQIQIDFWFEEAERRSNFPVLQGQRPIIDTHLHFRATNVGRVLANYVNVVLYLPMSLMPETNLAGGENRELDGKEYLVLTKRNSRRDVVGSEGFSPRYGPSWFDPILPGRSQTWDIFVRDMLWPDHVWDEEIIWELYADNGAVTRGKVAVREISMKT